ncbi:unnamed protein product [Mesocestoides corti]|uniref:Uncharacterized protein n=1 Tax=Mesocestoides corti TaxID=53468 RepID=A0A3P6HBT4_MESCO|nr:unnamed protein product [Mesocestoides corti]
MVFSDYFTRDYSKLDDLFEFTLQSLPANFFMEASRLGLRSYFASSPWEVTLKYDIVRQIVSWVLFETIIASSSSPYLPGDIRHDILGRLDELSQGIMQLHSTGKLQKGGFICRNPHEFAQAVDKLLEPLLLFELERVVKKPETLLSHLLLTRKTLSANLLNRHDAEELAPLTTKNLSHFLFEVLFIGQYALTPCLRTILAALTLRSEWRKQLVAEISDHLRNCSHKCRRHSSVLMEKCMDLDSKCLSFAKSICLESVRFNVSGWPLGALREALRDGDSFFAGDVVLLNEPAVFHDTAIWFMRDLPPLATSIKFLQFPFDPVGRHGTETANYLASRVLLNSRVCFMRRDFIFRLLLATTIEIFTQYSLKPDQVEGSSEFSDLPLYLPLDPSLMCDAVLAKQGGKDS